VLPPPVTDSAAAPVTLVNDVPERTPPPSIPVHPAGRCRPSRAGIALKPNAAPTSAFNDGANGVALVARLTHSPAASAFRHPLKKTETTPGFPVVAFRLSPSVDDGPILFISSSIPHGF
jgi:hypothetical protein